jgi:hypothetical protein
MGQNAAIEVSIKSFQDFVPQGAIFMLKYSFPIALKGVATARHDSVEWRNLRLAATVLP